MNPNWILHERRAYLGALLSERLQQTPQAHTVGFVERILTNEIVARMGFCKYFTKRYSLDEITYSGFPVVAHLGYRIGAAMQIPDEWISGFEIGVKRVLDRAESRNTQTPLDDVALLGLADGLARLGTTNVQFQSLLNRLLLLIENERQAPHPLSRLRDLSADLLDHRGRLRVPVSSTDNSTYLLDFALRNTWPSAFDSTPVASGDTVDQLLAHLMTVSMSDDETEDIAVALRCLDLLVDYACRQLTPSAEDTVEILKRIGHGFKRWVMMDKPSRKDCSPVHWIIDNEYHVQSLLWAVLYPIYGSELVDEDYLPNWGFTRPRVDLCIRKLKLIIEVKIARSLSDWNEFEGQIGEDIGLYFRDTNLYDRMIVFVYDDCDTYAPERYEGFQNALRKRDQVVDVVIVRRPSMIPSRDARSW